MLRPRITMLMLLLPLGALWWWLANNAPYADWPGLNSFHDGQRFSLSHHLDDWEEFLLIDIDNKQCRLAQDPREGYPPTGSGWTYWVDVKSTDKAETTMRLNVFSHVERRTMRSIEMRLPLSAVIRPVAGRFIVVDMDNEIRWIDVTDPQETMHVFPIPRGAESWIWRHPTLPVFRRTALKPAPPQSTAAPQSYTELFRFDEQGQLRLLGSWTHATGGAYPIVGDVEFQADTIASLDVAGQSIELRSVADAQLIKTIKLTPPLDMTQQAFGFAVGKLIVANGPRIGSEMGQRYYCLAQEKWLVPPQEFDDTWTTADLQLSEDSRTALWIGRNNRYDVYLTDPATDRLARRIQGPGKRFTFLDNNTLISIDPWFALTIRQHDLQTGATLWTWRPFWWSLPLFAIALILSIVWVIGWLRMAKSSHLWAWLDLHTLLLLFMALIVLRVHSAGTPAAVMRMPYQHAIYIASGFQLVAWAWLVLGSGSVISRLSQLLVVYAIVIGSLSQALSANAQMAWTGAALVSIPSLISLPLFIVARVRGYKWPSMADLQGSREATASAELVTLRQLLIVTAICALLSLAIRPIVPGISGVFQLQWPVWRAVGITLCGLLGIYLAVANNTKLLRCGWTLALCMLVLLLAEALTTAAYTGWWKPIWLAYHEDELRYALGLYLVAFLVTRVLNHSLPYKFLSDRRSNQKNLEASR